MLARALALALTLTLLLPALAWADPTPGPGQPTPTGTLAGVGTFCWSGSAWVACGPSGGGGSVPTGPAGTPNPLVVTVQGIAGGTALPTTATATFNGFDSGPVQVTSSTLNAGSYSAGMSLGGLLSVPIARINGGSGGLSLIGYKSLAGSVGQVVFRIWQKSPASTTCTDHTAFVSNATDDVQLLVAPFALTPAALAVTTGDAATYAAIQPGRLSWVNSDTSPGKNLYVCVLTVATDTVDESSTVSVRLSGDLN